MLRLPRYQAVRICNLCRQIVDNFSRIPDMAGII
jgi:hypothetical protein